MVVLQQVLQQAVVHQFVQVVSKSAKLILVHQDVIIMLYVQVHVKGIILVEGVKNAILIVAVTLLV